MTLARPQLFVLDRSRERHRGLADLVPGGLHLPLGLEAQDAPAINPWDVPDVANVGSSKIAFLVRLQTLLVGGRESGRPFGLSQRESSLLTIAIRDVYARAADAEGAPSHSFLRAVLADLARQERADPAGSEASAATYDDLSRRLQDICSGGAYGHVLDRATRLDPGDAPLVVISTGAVADEIVAPVLLSVFELVNRLAERPHGPSVSLLADALDLPPSDEREEPFPPAFPRDSLLNGLHESYLRRRMRAGEARAVAYLHAISDVAHFLHPPTGLAECPHRPGPCRHTTRSTS
ncbi:MAG: TraG P-loop domain [Solirubrobacteraceae bacterium]|nr:TraG P-loop domain [Solirubrobacteraceae bacterium]